MPKDTAVKDKQSKNILNNKGRLAAFILIGVVLIGAVVFYFTVFKGGPSSSLWIEAEMGNLDYSTDVVRSAVGDDFLAFGDTLASKPWSLRAGLGGSLKQGDLGLPARHLQMVNQVLDRGVFNVSAGYDPGRRLLYGDGSLSVHGISLLGGRFFYSDGLAGVRAPQIFDYYLTVDGDGPGRALRLFEPGYRGPDGFSFPAGVRRGLDSFWELIGDNVADDSVVIEGSDTGPGSVVTVSMSEDELAGIWDGLGDSGGVAELAGGLSSVLRLMALVPDISEWFGVAVTGVADILDGEQEPVFPEGLEMVLSLDGDGNIVERSLSFGLADSGSGPPFSLLFDYNSRLFGSVGGNGNSPHEGGFVSGEGALQISSGSEAVVVSYLFEVDEGSGADASSRLNVTAEAGGDGAEAGEGFGIGGMQFFVLDLERSYGEAEDGAGVLGFDEAGGDFDFVRCDSSIMLDFPVYGDAGIDILLSQVFVMDRHERFYVDLTELDFKVNDPVFGFGDVHFVGEIDWEIIFKDELAVQEPDLDGSVNLSEVEAGEWEVVLAELRESFAAYVDRFRFLLR